MSKGGLERLSAGAKPGFSKGLRKEQRLPGCKPVTVLGQDIYGRPFSQNTFTVEISATGARLQGLPPVARDAMLLLECGQERARYRVAWIGEKGDRFEGHVGLECVDQDKFIFGIVPPTSGSFYDEYRRVEAELHRSEGRYKSLFENSLGLICIHDMQGVLLSANPAAARALGFDPNSGVGKNLSEFLAPSVRAHFPEYLRRVREHGQDSGLMLVVGRRKEKHVWLYRNLLVSENGDPPYVVGHAMDITEQKRVERQLQTALKDLQRALAEVRTLKGLLSVCAWCKRIRTQEGQWTDLESYVAANSEANFSHGVCPECLPKI
jgi:PAS domain S-box-containing protein